MIIHFSQSKRFLSIASLSMYDQPWVRHHNDTLWRGLHKHLADLNPPQQLDRETPLSEQWRNPQLFLSQTCGYPYRVKYFDTLQLVATPIYNSKGCSDAQYTSVIVSRYDGVDEIAEAATFAANSADSLSGAVAMEFTLFDQGFEQSPFEEIVFSGGHHQSMQMVAARSADLCCIDAQTYALICAGDPTLVEQLKVIGQSRSFPALPLVTSSAQSDKFVSRLRDALPQLLSDTQTSEALQALHIEGFKLLNDDDYAEITNQYEKLPQALRGCVCDASG